MSKDSINNVIKLLNLYKESGIDETIGNITVDRTKITGDKSKITGQYMKKNIKVEVVDVNRSIELDGDIIDKISTLDQLKKSMSEFKGCELYKSATNMVFSDGDPSSEIMLIGEAPGHDEDMQAKPFVGRSGKLLDKMLEAIELGRDKVYIANIIPWRPPSNRRPTESEINSYLPFLKKHIELINPKAIMLLGSTATYALLKNKESISQVRGKWIDIRINSKSYPTLPTFHPAFLLRQPGQKKYVWEDLKSLQNKIIKGD